MPRTTSELVAGLIEVDASISLEPFIATASLLVSRVADADSDLEGEHLELIERWLAAHFYAMRDPRPVSERADTIEVVNQSKVGFNLALSHYGQTAMTLDTSGTLKALSDGKKFTSSVTWLGTDDE